MKYHTLFLLILLFIIACFCLALGDYCWAVARVWKAQAAVNSEISEQPAPNQQQPLEQVSSAASQTPIKTRLVFSDDFSQGFDKWQLAQGSWDYWSIEDNMASALIESHYRVADLVPKDEFWQADWQNYILELDVYPIRGVDRNVSWGYEDPTHWYEVHFVQTFFHLVRKIGDRLGISRRWPFRMQNGDSYHLKITFNQGNIKVSINGEEVADADDWSFNDNRGKIALRAGTGAEAPTQIRFDNVKVYLIEEPSAEVELWKQTDPQWAEEEYDFGTRWSGDPTIRRWGCAMTSMAMIMRFYGLDTLPDGTALNPSVFNAWLKNEPDGYVGTGLINWLAGLRLVRQMSDQYSTPERPLPKLEYARRSMVEAMEIAIAEIQQARPVILQMPGHFLVADGVVGEELVSEAFANAGDPTVNTLMADALTTTTDLKLKDPFYNVQLWSEHNTDLLSTRTLRPSQTDLSYLLLVYPDNFEVLLKDADGNLIDQSQTFKDEITDPSGESGENTPDYWQQILAKPVTGQYYLEISRRVGAEDGQQAPSSDVQLLELYAYDQLAEVSIFKQALDFQYGEPIIYLLDYQKDGPSTLSLVGPLPPENIWTSFRQLLAEHFASRAIRKFYAFARLDRLAAFAQERSPDSDLRYQQLVQSNLQSYQEHIQEEAYQELWQKLEEI